MASSFFFVPFPDQRCDESALHCALRAGVGDGIILREKGKYPDVKDSQLKKQFNQVKTSDFSKLKANDTLWIFGHGAKFHTDRVAYIDNSGKQKNLSPKELATTILSYIASGGGSKKLNYKLVMCFSANNWFGTSFAGKFSAEMKALGAEGSVTGYKGLIDDVESRYTITHGDITTKGSSRINYGANAAYSKVKGAVMRKEYPDAAYKKSGNFTIFPL